VSGADQAHASTSYKGAVVLEEGLSGSVTYRNYRLGSIIGTAEIDVLR
jgi:hypothetical protein